MTLKVPENLKFTKDHEWVLIENDQYTMGITDYAQNALGDIVFIELPSIGSKLLKGKSLGVVESIKSVSDIYAPISGEVAEVNNSATTHPDQCNSDPYGTWFVKVKFAKSEDLSELLDSKQYQGICH